MRYFIRLHIHLLVIQKEYECLFQTSSSLRDNLDLFFLLIAEDIENIYECDDKYLVYGNDFQNPYDKYVSIYFLDIEDGDHLYIC